MKTRFTSLVKIKKNDLTRCELVFKKASIDVQHAKQALKEAYNSLKEIQIVKHGAMKQMLANRVVLNHQRVIIEDKKNWLLFAKNQQKEAKEVLKNISLEYEKFKYLELQEIEKILKEQKMIIAKEMDEVAILSYNTRKIR